ncbi:PQQ-dependent sugar dehydrogenase [Maribacter chungangensis]|uniref:PQQ-dependent sugar dehydrogenase n=1 Tax=Maribacter chungangensis TaxID=1069117 RepID=A0ABW3B5C3_9FLAO
MHIFFLRCKSAFFCFLFFYGFVTSHGQISYEEAFPSLSFNLPVEIQNASDGSNRLFVVEQQGTIKVFPNTDQVTSEQVRTFLDISKKVSYSSGQEIGLLGLAFHPEFESNGYIFVYYIDSPNNYRINISRFQVSSSDPNLIDPNSETVIAQFMKNQAESNHNGGKITFGPDGYLYISVGDGGGGGDPLGNAQNLNSIFGSILRIDVDINGDNPVERNPELPNGNYEIPSDNPRIGQSGLDEIYAWGIRNTWKMSFDVTGRLWGADVGQNASEEINIISNGGNYGWNRFEANANYRTTPGLTTTPDIKPIFSYDHTAGDKSITGGYVYRGNLTSASLQNKYIFGDYLTGRVWALTYNEGTGAANSELLFRASGESISSFGEDEAGELYFSGYGTNAKLFKLTETVMEPVNTAINGIGEWTGISSGTDGTVETIAIASDNTIYVGGNFSNVGGVSAANLAVITPEKQWQPFGTGSNGPIYSIAIAPNGNIFVAGEFTQIGGVSANNIAFWNGSVWSALDEGTNGPILAIRFDQEGTLFAGGVFSNAGTARVNNIASWQGDSWLGLADTATGIAGTNNEIRSLAFDGSNHLYIGGNFDAAGGVPTARIAKWDGANWSALEEGTSGFVQAIAITDNFLYAGGNFNLAGNKAANRIARFDFTNETWETLGLGLSGSVNAIALNGNNVYAGGNFETASDIGQTNKIVNNIARWSAEKGWEALGQDMEVGVNSTVGSLAFDSGANLLYVGGIFDIAGGVQNNNLAIWGESFCTPNSITPVYTVNGILDSGSNTVSLNEGSSLVLGMLPNTADFTLTLPNGETVTGDYTLDSVTADDAGTYTYITAIGCVERLELSVNSVPDTDGDGIENAADVCPNSPTNEAVNENGCAPSQLDDDQDGITNDLDQCTNTSIGAVVDSNGCAATEFPDDRFSLTTTASSCTTSPNGTLQLTASVTGTYVASLLKDSQTIDTFEFTDILAIENLDSGSYELCIGLSTNNLERCYPLEIENSVVDIEVRSSLNDAGTLVTLNLSGATKYYITWNGTLSETELNEITLELTQDINLLEVSSDTLCQGVYRETIAQKDAFIVYPNPITDFVNVDMRYLTDERIVISLYTASGKLLHTESYTTDDETITIDTEHLRRGHYMLHLKGTNINKGFKLIK